MGVTGLLQQLQGAQQKTTLAKYKGKKLAVDTYGWLHRGLILCAQDLCTDVPTRAYVTSVMRKIDMVRHFGAEPVLVFDGAPLPTKEATHNERRANREKARAAAQASLAKGDKKSAWKEFMRAAGVTPEMAKLVMVECDRVGVQYVVAPYEADPQMVYLEKTGVVDGILSEDSDLLVFGCRTLVTKLKDTGECVEVSRDRLSRVPRMLLHTYTAEQWRLVAILSGCDYTKGIPGVGIKTAFNIVLRFSGLDRVVAFLKADGRTVPDDFMEEAIKADLAFQYQKVFDVAANTVTTLCEIVPDSELDMEALEACCGRTLGSEIHAGICRGQLHPSSHETLISREQSLTAPRSHSMGSTVASAIFSSAKPAGESKKGAALLASQSFSCSRSITSFFKSGAPQTLKVSAATSVTVTSTKRPSADPLQMSPNSKKLKRLAQPSSGSVAAPAHSKFFTSTHTMLPPASAPLTRAKPDYTDFGFCSGDSEVPDNSSSPVRKTETTANDAGALTDDDTDANANSMTNSARTVQLQVSIDTGVASDADEGYDDEIDESPIKLEKIGLQWRQKFAMGAGQVSATKLAVLLMKKEASTVDKSVVKTSSGPEDKSRSDSPDLPLSPRTPSDSAPDSVAISEAGSPVKSPRKFAADSEDDLALSPQRASACLVPRRSPRLKLLRFAFTGN